MNSVLVIFVCAIVFVAGQVPDIPRFPSKHPRRPPPPFDLPIQMPWPRRPAVPVSSTTTFPPIVLYKPDCDPCMPGWGIKSGCNSTSNTVCKPCPLGTWSPRAPHYRPCVPCGKCGRGQFEEVTCVPTRDTICNTCSNPMAKINEDFLRKCNWKELNGKVDPRELDLDDTRFQVEVIDLQSKELINPLDSPEFGSNEDDLEHLLLAGAQHEEDITLDDPEIDLEEPAPLKSMAEEDVSKEEEVEWARLLAMRSEASAEIDQISRRIDAERGLDDEEDDVEDGPRRFLMQPSRPFPQMVPAPRLPNMGKEDDEVDSQNDVPVENNFPPSYHSYPIDSLAHAGESQRRKAIVLLVLTCAIVLSTIIFVVCYVREYCRRRNASAYNRVLVVNLSPEEREIVRQSANALEEMERAPPKKYRSGSAYTGIEMGVENPLEAYLNCTDERRVATESLVENEVLDDPKVHRRTEIA